MRVYAKERFVEIRHFEYFCALFVVVFLTYGGQVPSCLQGWKKESNTTLRSVEHSANSGV